MIPEGRRFSSTYQPSPASKSNGHRRASLRRQALYEALEIGGDGGGLAHMGQTG